MLSFFDREVLEQEAKRLSQNLRAIVCQRLVPAKDGGKVAAIEILINTPRMADLIAKLDYESMKQTVEQGANYGMQTFDQALCSLYDSGNVNEDQAVEFAESKTQVMQHIRFTSKSAQKRDLSGGLTLQDIDRDK